MDVSYYRNSEDSEGVVRDLDKVLIRIRSSKRIEMLIDSIRSIDDKDKKDELKRQLPSFITSGVFHPTRGMNNLVAPTGLMILDIDTYHKKKWNCQFPLDMKYQICQDPHTYACFISPGGKGVKVIVQIGNVIEMNNDEVVSVSTIMDSMSNIVNIYRNTFTEVIAPYYRENFDVELDPSGKNVNRICYMSYDPYMYKKVDSTPFVGIYKQENYEVRSVDPGEIANVSLYEKMEYAINCCKKMGKEFVENERNNFVFYLSCTLNRFGVYFEDALTLISLWYGINTENKDDEWHKTIKSAYVHNKNEFNRYPVIKSIRKR